MSKKRNDYHNLSNECVDKLVGNLLWIDRADPRCAMSKASSSRGRASETDMKHMRAILRYLGRNPGVMTVEPMQFSLEAAKRSVARSGLTFSDSDGPRDSDKTV